MYGLGSGNSDIDDQQDQRAIKVSKPLIMHEWESQEKLLNDIEHQDVRDVLKYIDFVYSRHEWDNIPVIVPRYLIYLSKYIKGLSSFCYKVSTQESAESLRADLNANYQQVQRVIDEQRQEDLREKKVIDGQIQEVKGRMFTIDQQLLDAQNEVKENLAHGMWSLYKTPQDKLLEHKSYLKEDTNPEIYNNKARQYSLNQLKELFYIHLNRSKLCHQFLDTQQSVKTCESNIQQLFLADAEIKTYIDQRMNDLTLRFDKFEEQSQLQQQYNESKQADLGNRISMHNDQISRLQDFQKETVKFHESVRQMHDKTNQRIVSEREKLEQTIEHNTIEVKFKISEIEKFTISQFDSISKDMDGFKLQVKENIDEREKGILTKTNDRLQELQKFVEDTANDMNQKRIEIQEKYEKKFNKIKEVITEYFEKYDVDLEEVKINMKVLNQKYADWSKVLIEPSSLNEARLYALETRLHEEEEIRIKEYDYIRDLMKKLIYSLEQTNMNSLDVAKFNNSKSQEHQSRNQTPQLPNLLQTQSINNRSTINQSDKSPVNISDLGTNLHSKTNEILMLKRLNFLKTSLDGHSPRETTTQLRIKSQKKRDARVVEIWKKEMEHPSVQEILNQYLKTKPEVKVDLNERPAKLQLATIQQVSRNHNTDDSVIITKRGDHSLQPLSTTAYETSISNVKTSNDSAFITQKINALTHTAKFGQTFHHQPSNKLNQSLGSIEYSSTQLADKINKNKFLTNSDQKKILHDLRKGDSHLREPPFKDKMHETFWSDFDATMQERHITLQQKLNASRARQGTSDTIEEHGQHRKNTVKTLAKISQEKRRNGSIIHGDNDQQVDQQ